MPVVSFLHSSTNGCRNELKSFGAFGPGMMLRGMICASHVQCKRYNSELGNSNYYTTFSVSKGVIQRKKESWSSATSSPNDKQIHLALWLSQSKQGWKT